MRHLALAILALATVAVAGPAAAQTYAPGYPVCLHVYGPASYVDCSFTSLGQCAATASGRGAQCEVNPFYANAAMEPGRRRLAR